MVRNVIHAGITVSDLNVSIPFYTDLLGLKLIKLEEPRSARGEKLGVPGAVIQCAVFETADGAESVELIQYFKPDSPDGGGAPVNTVGNVHIAFRVDDIDSMIREMKSKGVVFMSDNYEVIGDGPLAGWKWIYFKDPDGTNLELIEETL